MPEDLRPGVSCSAKDFLACGDRAARCPLVGFAVDMVTSMGVLAWLGGGAIDGWDSGAGGASDHPNSRSLADRERYAVGKSEMGPKSAAIEDQIGTGAVAHQPQRAAVFCGELVGLDQYPQSGRGQILHTIKIHHHDLGGGQRLGQHGGQRWRGQRVQLPGHRDDAGLQPALGDLHTPDVGRDHAVHNCIILRKKNEVAG